ncbi:hypothetical protein AAXB25_14800 [Paenibacillus lautus]|uniref:hypothetical protein n=1 Tax=Paenibacillus lautus TaxID=1401 RepID=UPI003D28F614
MNKREQEIIKDNLRAYLANFEPIRIEKADSGKGFYVFQGNSESYVQFCYNIDYLNGWLYGAVQAKCKQLIQKSK